MTALVIVVDDHAVVRCRLPTCPTMAAQALQAGADGFITQCSGPAMLVQALRRVGQGEIGAS